MAAKWKKVPGGGYGVMQFVPGGGVPMKRLALFLLLLVSFAYGQQTTVTGHVQKPSEVAATRTKLRFELIYCGGNQEKIAGAASLISFAPFQITPDTTGTFSTPLWGNDQIRCGTTIGSSRWRVTHTTNRVSGPAYNYHFQGASVDLDDASACSSNPPVLTNCASGLKPVRTPPPPVQSQPTLPKPATAHPSLNSYDSTAGVFSTTPISQADVLNLALNLATKPPRGATQYCDQFPGATADVQINACIAALDAHGGIADARGYGATSQTIATRIAIGNNSGKRVQLLVSNSTSFNITAVGGIDVLQVAAGSALTCEPSGAPSVANGGGFQLASTANVRSVIAPLDRSGNQGMMYVSGCALLGNATATVTGALLDVQGVFTTTRIANVNIWNIYNTIGLRILPGTGANGGLQITSDVVLDNVQANGGAVVGARPCVLNATGAGSGVGNITFLGGACQHAGSGQYELEIDGLNAGGGSYRMSNLYFYGFHIETSNGSRGIKLRDAQAVIFDGLDISGPTGGTAGPNLVDISESAGGIDRSIEFRRAQVAIGGGIATYINNTNSDGVDIPATAFPADYLYRASTGVYSGAMMLSETSTATGYIPSPATKLTICYSDASPHALRCSYNGAAFSIVPLVDRAQTWTATQTRVPLASPTILTGISQGSGFKHLRGTTGCTTGASAGAACTTTVTWASAFADADYTVSCTGNGIGAGVPLQGGITAKIAASVTFQTVAATPVAAKFTNIECIAVHD